MSTDNFPQHGAAFGQQQPTTVEDAPMESYVPQQDEDFFNFGNVRHRFDLGKGGQYFEYKTLNEGEKSQYQRAVSRPLRINTKSSEAIATMDPSRDRHALIEAAVTDWHLVRNKQVYPFSKKNLRDILALFDPKVIEDLEFAIQKANPWMNAELTSEQLDEEIERLTEVRDQVREREEGEAGSASK